MSFGYDPELPAGFQEADLEMRELEAAAARNAALRRRGICTHGWCLGGGATMNRDPSEIDRDRQRGNFPGRPTDAAITCQNDIPVGQVLCLDCGTLIEDPFA